MHAHLVARIQSRTRPGEGGCVLWTGAANRQGYGRIRDKGRLYSPHRVVLEHALGRALESWEDTCHSCHVPRCCNPAHLTPGTRLENVRQSAGRPKTPTDLAAVPRCPKGHLLGEGPCSVCSPTGHRLDGIRQWFADRRLPPDHATRAKSPVISGTSTAYSSLGTLAVEVATSSESSKLPRV